MRLDGSLERYSDRYTSKLTSISISPFLRYYFLPAERKVNLLADVRYGFGWVKHKTVAFPDQVFKYKYNIFSFMAGPAVFLNEHTSLEIVLGNNHESKNANDTIPQSRLYLGVGLQFHLAKK